MARVDGVARAGGADDVEAFVGDASRVARASVPPAMYFVVVAARRASALPAPGPALSLFSDAGETELRRAAAAAAEAIRLDALLKHRERVVAERDAQLARADAHVTHLEGLLAARDPLIAERERVVAERDRDLRLVNERAARLEQLAAERERLVAERDELLARTNDHVTHLEELAAFRERLVVERDAAIAARDARIEADGRALALARDGEGGRAAAHRRGRAPACGDGASAWPRRGAASRRSRANAGASTARSTRRNASSPTASRSAGGSRYRGCA